VEMSLTNLPGFARKRFRMSVVLTIIAAPSLRAEAGYPHATVTAQMSDGSGAPPLELQQLLISVAARLAEFEAER
jgi:hypothetical protein